MSVIVIGGGMVGLACAHYLAEAGHEVTILDMDHLGRGCSSGNLGYVCPSHLLPLATPDALRDGLKSLFDRSAAFRISPQADGLFLRWLWRFLRAANREKMFESAGHLHTLLKSTRDEYSRLAGELDCQWRRRGLLYLFREDEALERHAAGEGALADRFEIPMELIESEALKQLEPGLVDGLAGGMLYPDDACLRPEQLARAFADGLKQRGAQILEHCRVDDFIVEGGQLRSLETSAGTLTADHYVLATGVFSGKIGQRLGLDLPVVVGKGYSLTLDKFEGMPSRPLLFPEYHVGVTPFDDGFRIGSMMELVGFDTSKPQRRIDQLRAATENFLKAPIPQGGASWFGWRPMTPDSLPIIGAAPGIDNLMLATGHNMLGVTLAPVTGKLVAEMVSGQQTHLDAHPYRATRW